MERWCWWCKVSFRFFLSLSLHNQFVRHWHGLSTLSAENVRVFCHRSLHSSHCHVLSYLNIRTFLVMNSSMWCCEGHGLRRKGAVCQCSCCMFWTHDCESSSKIRIVGTTCRHKPIGSLNERNKSFVFLCFFSHWSVYADKVSNPQIAYSTKRHISQQRVFVFGIFMDFYGISTQSYATKLEQTYI